MASPSLGQAHVNDYYKNKLADFDETGLIPVTEALALILGDVQHARSYEIIALENDCRRTLAEAITAPCRIGTYQLGGKRLWYLL